MQIVFRSQQKVAPVQLRETANCQVETSGSEHGQEAGGGGGAGLHPACLLIVTVCFSWEQAASFESASDFIYIYSSPEVLWLMKFFPKFLQLVEFNLGVAFSWSIFIPSDSSKVFWKE